MRAINESLLNWFQSKLTPTNIEHMESV